MRKDYKSEKPKLLGTHLDLEKVLSPGTNVHSESSGGEEKAIDVAQRKSQTLNT